MEYKEQILAASDALAVLATAFAADGWEEKADELFRLCADLELRSPELQACWGGPLNGQEGRRRIMEDLIAQYRPTCIIETGTFRGLTTGWFAQRFGGPILTCEATKRYFYQADKNLANHPQVRISLADSRSFMSALDATAAIYARPLVYLDAHWEQDLPLREELRILIHSFRSFVAVIDDFRVPGDDGYTWDDYGAGNSLTVDYLAAAEIRDCVVLFPTLPSDEETGARRGCCVVARDVECSLEDSGLLRGNSLERWLEIQAAGPPHVFFEQGVRPSLATETFEAKQASFPDQIALLRQHLLTSQNDAIAKEVVIQDLKRACDERLSVINELEQALKAERSKW